MKTDYGRVALVLAPVAILVAALLYRGGRPPPQAGQDAPARTTPVVTQADLERQLQIAKERARAAEGDVAALLTAIGDAANGSNDGAPRLESTANAAYVATRRRAEALIKEGRNQEALDEYLRGYLLLFGSGTGSVQRRGLISGIGNLGRNFSPAADALRDLRRVVLERAENKPQDGALAYDIGEINKALLDQAENIRLYETMSPDDARKRILGRYVWDEFIAAGRYEDAANSKRYSLMLAEFDIAVNADYTKAGTRAASERQRQIRYVATNIEVLTGAGRLEDAQDLTRRLLTFDSSPETQTLVAHHVRRARSRAN